MFDVLEAISHHLMGVNCLYGKKKIYIGSSVFLKNHHNILTVYGQGNVVGSGGVYRHTSDLNHLAGLHVDSLSLGAMTGFLCAS